MDDEIDYGESMFAEGVAIAICEMESPSGDRRLAVGMRVPKCLCVEMEEEDSDDCFGVVFDAKEARSVVADLLDAANALESVVGSGSGDYDEAIVDFLSGREEFSDLASNPEWQEKVAAVQESRLEFLRRVGDRLAVLGFDVASDSGRGFVWRTGGIQVIGSVGYDYLGVYRVDSPQCSTWLMDVSHGLGCVAALTVIGMVAQGEAKNGDS